MHHKSSNFLIHPSGYLFGFPQKALRFCKFSQLACLFKETRKELRGEMSLSLASWARQPIGSIRILVVSFAFSWVPSLGPKIPKDGCFEWSIYNTRFISNNKRVNEAILMWTKWRHLFGLPQKALRLCILHAFKTMWFTWKLFCLPSEGEVGSVWEPLGAG